MLHKCKEPNKEIREKINEKCDIPDFLSKPEMENPEVTLRASHISKTKQIAAALSEDDARIFCSEIIKKYPGVIFDTCINEMIASRDTIATINESINVYNRR